MKSFKTQYSSHPRYLTNVGSREKIVYTGEYDEKGNLELKEIGKDNLYAYIQSFKDSCDINVILKRFTNGETNVLSQKQGAYGDFTIMPKTYAEMLNRVIDAENYFNSLPVEERAKYGHNFADWLYNFDKNIKVDAGVSESSPTVQVDKPIEEVK